MLRFKRRLLISLFKAFNSVSPIFKDRKNLGVFFIGLYILKSIMVKYVIVNNFSNTTNKSAHVDSP